MTAEQFRVPRGVVLAVDPGPQQSAWVIWDGETIKAFGKRENDHVAELIAECEADTLAIEMIASYGMAVGREVFETCVWTGRFMERWLRGARVPHHKSYVLRIPRTEIKMHHCHTTRANDSNIRQALIDRLGAPGVKAKPGKTYGITKDCWAALALGVCVVDRM